MVAWMLMFFFSFLCFCAHEVSFIQSLFAFLLMCLSVPIAYVMWHPLIFSSFKSDYFPFFHARFISLCLFLSFCLPPFTHFFLLFYSPPSFFFLFFFFFIPFRYFFNSHWPFFPLPTVLFPFHSNTHATNIKKYICQYRRTKKFLFQFLVMWFFPICQYHHHINQVSVLCIMPHRYDQLLNSSSIAPE